MQLRFSYLLVLLSGLLSSVSGGGSTVTCGRCSHLGNLFPFNSAEECMDILKPWGSNGCGIIQDEITPSGTVVRLGNGRAFTCLECDSCTEGSCDFTLSPFTAIANELIAGRCPACDGKRRNLAVASTESDEWREKCGDVDYAIWIGIDDHHMCVMAEPTDSDSGCESVRFHQRTNEVKEIQPALLADLDATYPLGTFKLKELLTAYNGHETSGGEWDIIEDNCSDVVIDMVCNLDIPIEQDMLVFTAEYFLANEAELEWMLTKMQVSPNLKSLGLGGKKENPLADRNDDAEDVMALITHYVKNRATCSVQALTGGKTKGAKKSKAKKSKRHKKIKNNKV
jgi:hypothetical protein